jgi:hypothetical protein
MTSLARTCTGLLGLKIGVSRGQFLCGCDHVTDWAVAADLPVLFVSMLEGGQCWDSMRMFAFSNFD